MADEINTETPETPSESGAVATATKPRSKTKGKRATRGKVDKLPPYNVVLLDDATHTYEYVIEMLAGLFGYSELRGYQLAKQVDSEGRAIVATAHREHAELKAAQIESFGLDPRIPTCKSGMKAYIEPAEG